MKNAFLKQVFFLSLGVVGFSALLMNSVHAETSEVQDLRKQLNTINKRLEELETQKAAAPQKQSTEKSDAAKESAVKEAGPAEIEKIPPAKESKDMQTYWKEGVQFKYAKDGIELTVGGLIQGDFLFMSGNQDAKNAFGTKDPNGSGPHLRDGAEFRRARIHVSGLLFDHLQFKGEYDFADGTAAFKDVYLALVNVPYLGGLFVGHFKEPFSLDELTSDKYIPFMERGLLNIFVPSRNMGIMVQNHIAKRFTYALGVFRETNDQGIGFGDNEYNFTTRVTALPLWLDDGKILIHLGGAFSYRNPTNEVVRFAPRPESHLANRFLDTRDPTTMADMQVEDMQLWGAEAATVLGPFSMQAEYILAQMDILPGRFTDPPNNTKLVAPFPYSGGTNAQFQGFYVFASVFLTGESRPYNGEQGVFSRVKPKRVFLDGKGGTGAVELVARYSWLDMQDGFFNPFRVGQVGKPSFGSMNNYTLGANWYLNPNTRIMANYIISDPDPNGLAHLFTTRFQVDF